MNPQRKVAWKRGIILALAYAAMCSCVTQGVPTHGGGKRFFFEQALIAKATDSAVKQLDLAPVASGTQKPVNVYVVAMGDAGGGSEGGSSFDFIGLGGAPGSGAPSVSSSSPSYGSYSFANTRDIEYLRGKVVQALAASGIRVAGRVVGQETGGDIYVLVSEFGTAKEGFNLLVYREVKLAARVAMEAFYIPEEEIAGMGGPSVSLGSGECTTEYLARYLFGTGPIHGAEIKVMPGAIPATIVWPTDQDQDLDLDLESTDAD